MPKVLELYPTLNTLWRNGSEATIFSSQMQWK